MGREDPVGHRDALGLEELGRGLVLGRVAGLWVEVVAGVEVVRLPGDQLALVADKWGQHQRGRCKGSEFL